ncbi:peptidylprolyl isomerase [Rhodovulum marinum]|uniref:Parvulin-like PPIase n=1 Tax=Rhodovulum marinum TaxID=320662 RepID=A0A4R2PYG9_9RHOB|nr:peptidylprolyl isomerase [Rhodovulum marinum]TCP40238.1 peptidyl-prolyl cis-trans isomerase C [Rhodovulum marinum]
MPKASMPLFTGVFVAGLMVLPALAQDQPVPPATAQTVVATVNGTDITMGHMILLHSRLPEEYRQLPKPVLFRAMLDQMVQQTLLAQSFDGEIPAFVEMSLENEKRGMIASQAMQLVIEEAVSEDAIAARYAAFVAGIEGQREFNASHILVDSEQAAREAIAELEGGKEFADVARERSTGPSAPNGGNLGWFTTGQMVAPFEAAVLEMEPGKVSAPVETQFGWHVIRLNEVRTATAPTLDEARGQIVDELRSNAIETRLRDLTESAQITRVEPDEIDTDAIADTSLLLE